MNRRFHGYCVNHGIVVYWFYRSLSRALMVLLNKDWDWEGLVIRLSIGGDRWYD